MEGEGAAFQGPGCTSGRSGGRTTLAEVSVPGTLRHSPEANVGGEGPPARNVVNVHGGRELHGHQRGCKDIEHLGIRPGTMLSLAGTGVWKRGCHGEGAFGMEGPGMGRRIHRETDQTRWRLHKEPRREQGSGIASPGCPIASFPQKIPSFVMYQLSMSHTGMSTFVPGGNRGGQGQCRHEEKAAGRIAVLDWQ